MHCTGDEAALADCKITPARQSASSGDGECEDGGKLVALLCGPSTRAGPEVCYMSEAGQRECWNVGGYGSDATMVCGSAGRRGGHRMIEEPER